MRSSCSELSKDAQRVDESIGFTVLHILMFFEIGVLKSAKCPKANNEKDRMLSCFLIVSMIRIRRINGNFILE